MRPVGLVYASALVSIKLRDFADAADKRRGVRVVLLQLIGPNAQAERLLTYLRAELARLATGRSMAMPRWKRQGREEPPRDDAACGLQLIDPAPRPRVMRPMRCRPASACPRGRLRLEPARRRLDALGQPLRHPRPGRDTRRSGRHQRRHRPPALGLRQSRQPNADQVEASVIEARLRALVYARQGMLAEMLPGRYIPPDVELPN